MIRKSLLNFVLMLLLCSSISCRRVSDFAQLDSLVQSWLSKGYYEGAALCIVQGDSILFQNSYGSYNADTKVYVASAGKWVAAAVIAVVVDQTPLDWEDEVERWLPSYRGDPKGKIRLRQLLSHTSGVLPYLPAPRVDQYNSLDSAVAEILPLDTVFRAGTRFQYGGLGMQIAGRMAEVAMGMTFEEIFQQELASPLGMRASHFVPIDTSGGHAPMLGGGLCTTLNDYIHFLNMMHHQGVFEGRRILRAETIRQMQADQIGDAHVDSGEYVERGLGLRHRGVYGLGLWREKIDEETGEAYQFSSPGWAGAYPWLNTREGVYGFFIAHVKGGANKADGFSSFYGSPILSETTSKILKSK